MPQRAQRSLDGVGPLDRIHKPRQSSLREITQAEGILRVQVEQIQILLDDRGADKRRRVVLKRAEPQKIDVALLLRLTLLLNSQIGLSRHRRQQLTERALGIQQMLRLQSNSRR